MQLAIMTKATDTLCEIMLAAERFCNEVEARRNDVVVGSEEKELIGKLGLCRTQLAYLQKTFNEDELELDNPLVRPAFRHLIIALMWVAFYSRTFIDFRLFRKLVLIDSSFSYMLIHYANSGQVIESASLPAAALPVAESSKPVTTPVLGPAGQARAKTSNKKPILLWATLALLILNLLVAIAGPKWKKHRHEQMIRSSAAVQMNGQPSKSDSHPRDGANPGG